MPVITVSPTAAKPAIISAKPPLKSGATTDAPVSFGTPSITAVLPSTLIFAPSLISSLTCLYLHSKIFSIITDVPSANESIAVSGACASVGKPGYGIVLIMLTLFNLFGADRHTHLLLSVISQPDCLSTGINAPI